MKPSNTSYGASRSKIVFRDGPRPLRTTKPVEKSVAQRREAHNFSEWLRQKSKIEAFVRQCEIYSKRGAWKSEPMRPSLLAAWRKLAARKIMTHDAELMN